MALKIDPKDPMSSVWELFVRWLTFLKEGHINQAFELIDGPLPGRQDFDAESLSNFFREFSQERGKTCSFRDIALDGEEFALCRADSVIRRQTDGAYYAHLWVPLRGCPNELVLGFYFAPCGINLYRVLLNDEPLVM